MKTLILITGDLATGKTTLAKSYLIILVILTSTKIK
jgi:tRNA A37 threonylcarbamoyladenosine biosynthesis protein TsaE